jgi:hypothetical protein
MKKLDLYRIIALAIILAGSPLVAQSTIVTKTFVGTIINGSLAGAQGTGSFSYEDDLVINGDEGLDPASSLTVMFLFDGQDFDETNDIDFDAFPVLEFSDFEVVGLNYILSSGINDVEFANPELVGLSMFSLFPAGGAFDFEIDIDIDAAYVPIPGAFWLLGSGFAGLVAFRKKRSILVAPEHFQ